MDLIDKQFCNGVCVLSLFTQMSAAYILSGSWCRHACDGDRHEQSLLRSPGQSCYAPITIEAQTSMSTQLLTQRKQYARTRPSFPV